MTQQEVADLVGISLRSYKLYENDEEKRDTIKYKYIVEQLSKINQIDEETGIKNSKGFGVYSGPYAKRRHRRIKC